MRVLPHLYELYTIITGMAGIMDILVTFEGDVKYAKLNIPELEDNKKK